MAQQVTPEEFKKKMQNYVEDLIRTQVDTVAEIGSTLNGEIKARIFNRGINAKQRKIGQYSTKPILIGSSSFINKSSANKVLGSKAKRRKLPWVTLDKKRLAVLQGGYKQLRGLNKRNDSYVDLQFRGDLFRSIRLRQKKGLSTMLISKDIEVVKARANEARFKSPIFSVSKRELKKAQFIEQKNFFRVFRKYFGNG